MATLGVLHFRSRSDHAANAGINVVQLTVVHMSTTSKVSSVGVFVITALLISPTNAQQEENETEFHRRLMVEFHPDADMHLSQEEFQKLYEEKVGSEHRTFCKRLLPEHATYRRFLIRTNQRSCGRFSESGRSHARKAVGDLPRRLEVSCRQLSMRSTI
jgi:hypothetical protein